MKKMIAIAAVALVAIFSSAVVASAQSTAVGTGTGIGTGVASANVNGAVGLAGLPGGVCSEGITLGAQGVGIGLSSLNRACLIIQSVPGMITAGLLTAEEGNVLILSAYQRLGFKLVRAEPSVAPTTSNATSLDPMRNVRACEYQEDGRVRVTIKRGLTDTEKQEASDACVASLQ